MIDTTIAGRRLRRRGLALKLGAAITAMAVLSACGGSGSGDSDAPAAEANEVASAELIRAAQEEGSVVVYAGAHTEAALKLAIESFEERYGIKVQATEEDSASTVQKVESELRAGNAVADVVSLSDDVTLKRWNAEGVIEKFDLPVADSLYAGLYDGTAHVPYSLNATGIAYNTEIAEDDVPTTWQEFMDLPNDTVIAVANPATSGTARSWAAVMWGMYGEEFFERLGEKNVLVVDSTTATPALVITGEADYAIPAVEALVRSPREDGEPIDWRILEGDVPGAASSMSVLKTAPHPNAAKLFALHHFSDEFADGFNALGSQSTRADIERESDFDLTERKVELGDPGSFTDAQVDTVIGHLK